MMRDERIVYMYYLYLLFMFIISSYFFYMYAYIKKSEMPLDHEVKNISPSVLPNFYGKSSEDPDEFIFEFDILIVLPT